jgi:molybdopterin converting factor small subunit
VDGTVQVLLFAAAREAAGRPMLDRPVGRAGLDLHELLDSLVAEFPALARILPRSRFAVNNEYIRGRSVRLRPGDELAIHPPYSGG